MYKKVRHTSTAGALALIMVLIVLGVLLWARAFYQITFGEGGFWWAVVFILDTAVLWTVVKVSGT